MRHAHPTLLRHRVLTVRFRMRRDRCHTTGRKSNHPRAGRCVKQKSLSRSPICLSLTISTAHGAACIYGPSTPLPSMLQDHAPTRSSSVVVAPADAHAINARSSLQQIVNGELHSARRRGQQGISQHQDHRLSVQSCKRRSHTGSH